MRGKRTAPLTRVSNLGLIPAHAGKTFGNPLRRSTAPAHPRACGENGSFHARALTNEGSSPRMRGKRGYQGFGCDGQRLIPAHAGKTRREASFPRMRAAHPRACGENINGLIQGIKNMGSSPRMRGKQPASRRCTGILRLIPAHAGKTRLARGPPSPRQAHPRACGENAGKAPAPESESGSSPRMRGKHPLNGFHPRCGRLIPAHAGKTAASPLDCVRFPAHPRACGENRGPFAVWVYAWGSSPRMRGKRSGRR